MTYTTPNTASAGELIRASYHNTYIRDNIMHLYENLPTRATLWHDEATVIAGTALRTTIATGHVYNHYVHQNAPAINDAFTQTFVLAEGTYEFYVIGRTQSDAGRVDWYIDDVLVVSAQDWYSSVTVSNVVKSASGIVIAEGGRHVLKGVVVGKNASSTDYRLPIVKYWFKQSSDS